MEYIEATQITKHFNSLEFQCPCGCGKTIINDKLIVTLEKLFVMCRAKSIIISSGYRCPAYDKQIGGFAGQHSKGNASDIKIIGQDGRAISTKYISCIAQELLVTGGIANIDTSYTYIHIDVRDDILWRGNEVAGNGTVTSDFYEYYNLTRDDVRKALNTSKRNDVEISKRWLLDRFTRVT